ncbi:MAG: DUF3343 domain-containing protein [Clostridium sp.]
MEYVIIIFKNTHDAIAAETVIQEKGYSIRIMPTPTSMTHSCGICVRLDKCELLDKILDIGFSYKNIYKRSQNGYELIK